MNRLQILGRLIVLNFTISHSSMLNKDGQYPITDITLLGCIQCMAPRREAWFAVRFGFINLQRLFLQVSAPNA